MVLEKTLEGPLDSKEIKQSILKEINPEYSLEGWMLKVKLQYFGHLMQRADSLEKTQILGKIEGRRRRWMAEDEISSVQSLSQVRLFATPWAAAHQASLSLINSWSLLKLMYIELNDAIELVTPSNHLILCFSLPLLPSISSCTTVFEGL